MNHTGVPRVATWLLKRFGCSPKNDSLLGDLIEQRQLGRSRLWYWNQVLMAIVAGLIGEVREHKLLTVRAVAIGWSVPLVYGFVLQPFISEIVWRLEPWVVLQHPTFYHSYYRSVETFIWDGLQNGHLLQLLLLQCIMGFLSGRLVARTHRGNPRAMVMAYAVTVAIITMMFWIYPLHVEQVSFLISFLLLIFVLLNLLTVASILFGGGVFRNSRTPPLLFHR